MEVKIQITDEEYNVLTATVNTYEIENDIVPQGECMDYENSDGCDVRH
ncbi:hypothetical protein [Butyrivibrio sp.]|nr:hypothetical protein [Butyrivibrio sp.]MBQ7428389.1 hypothetical protein [Butyrivibrio sp.]MBQ9303320.1 hypothetical protein [Butyrivibrio sp.]